MHTRLLNSARMRTTNSLSHAHSTQLPACDVISAVDFLSPCSKRSSLCSQPTPGARTKSNRREIQPAAPSLCPPRVTQSSPSTLRRFSPRTSRAARECPSPRKPGSWRGDLIHACMGGTRALLYLLSYGACCALVISRSLNLIYIFNFYFLFSLFSLSALQC